MTAARRPRRRVSRTLLPALLVLLFLTAAWLLVRLQELPQPTIPAERLVEAAYASPVWVGDLDDPEIEEASGFARSHRARDRMWLLNDSGNAARLYAVGLRGERHAAIEVRGIENDDWEDLASYEMDGQPYLLIADTGDNLSRKSTRTLHAVEEPAFEVGSAPRNVGVAWSLEFRFPDGPRDCEAVGVDATRGEILLLTKRDLPARLYMLTLPGGAGEAADGPVVARHLTEVFNIPQPTANDARGRFPLGAWLGQPTSLDVAPDASAALVLTYGAVYRFAKAPQEDWRTAFARLPQRIRTP
ncbi:MAG: hypothetical protein JRG84_06840, partial [Deltaproteobacteria bacterium]|nr:hypothetical protein [Deltaproteobacteria bacterium]